jgi:hypothetical protein
MPTASPDDRFAGFRPGVLGFRPGACRVTVVPVLDSRSYTSIQSPGDQPGHFRNPPPHATIDSPRTASVASEGVEPRAGNDSDARVPAFPLGSATPASAQDPGGFDRNHPHPGRMVCCPYRKRPPRNYRSGGKFPSRALQGPVYRVAKIISTPTTMIFWQQGLAPFE